MSATVPVHCTFVMPCSVAYVATTQHIINSPVITVAAFCLPVKQKTKVPISRRTACAQLMLPPQGPLHAEKLRPLWETITFTIAYGKHVAIEWTRERCIKKLTNSDPQIIRHVRLEQNPLFERMPSCKFHIL
ncbi:unnamed protein product [Angiostrongylus costaricensis]|uniref:Secreted protein n=1 Tax=Angiostrongylus costaricensis TaxID=334426 RepID=A0A0R3PJH8_ANGCS|nr:unnamed protein product [Angiostrongylus costaricensis]